MARTSYLNRDGKLDIPLKENEGDLYIWQMNGPGITRAGAVGNPETGWTLTGVKDFNSDEKTDILPQNNRNTRVYN